MKGLHELLADAVPELPEVDRVAEVGRRVRKRRRMRGAVATGLVVALTAGALVGTQWFGDVREESPIATPPPIAMMPTLDCPAELVERPYPPMESEGPLADESAVNALLCVYGGSTILPSFEIDHDVASVVRAMSHLVPKEMWEMRNTACPAPARRQYQMVLGYPDGRREVLRFDMNCGILSRDEVLRYGDITRPLEAFAAIVRAEGREFPYPYAGTW
ncbi:hypothetical protein LZG04_28845 [Saccharothrix sp. S26]|uniref:hypothetical protein n=1 Tax=Saccharothrix sp. S26 TaxID=2907215 RepID=UPI001F1D01C2|nr:hypothetical protein [Saccharothrix sp. S26]MCE6998775.1 hypothetical protein [Saccharothrix sp. S26]